MAIHLSHVFVLIQLLLCGTCVITSNLVEDLLLYISLGSHQGSSGAEERSETLLGVDDIRVTLGLSNALADLIVLKRGQTVNEA